MGCPGTESTQPAAGYSSGTPQPEEPKTGTPRNTGSPGGPEAGSHPEAAADPGTGSEPGGDAAAEGAIEVLRLRVVRRCCRNLAVALLRVEGTVAHVAVTSGQVSFRAQLVMGDTLRLAAGSELEVLRVDPEGAKVRWISELDDALGEAEVVTPAVPDDGALILEEMGIYSVGPLSLGVGNVRSVKDGALAVTITVFPEGYQANPMQDWDVHANVLAGEAREGAVTTLAVEDVGERGSRPGWVRLGWTR